MNKRILSVDVNINGLRVVKYQDATQYDKNTHFIGISFMDNVDLVGYALQVYYLPPSPSTTPYVDLFENLTQNMEIPIPDRVLQRNGEVTVEFVLSKNDELITVNQNFSFEVIKTINGTSLTAYPEGVLKETISQQIEKMKQLIANSQNKIDEYNNNTVEKTNKFDENAQTKTNEFNSNFEEKLKTYNDNSEEKLSTYNKNDILKTKNYNDNASSKTTEFNNNASKKLEVFNIKADEKATEAANTAALEANKLVVAQQTKSVKAVEDTADTKISEISEAGSGAIGAVESAKETAVSEGKKELDNYVTNTSKVQLNNYVDNTSKVELDNYIEQTSKVELDNYVANTSKVELDNYVTEKESQIKGATYTPSISPSGDLSFTNDKGLPNPETINIKGPQGDPGNFVFKVKNRHLMYYAVSNNSSPEFKLNKKHLIIKIK